MAVVKGKADDAVGPVGRQGCARGRRSSYMLPPSLAHVPSEALPDEEHLADGMAGSLIAALSRLRGFLDIGQQFLIDL